MRKIILQLIRWYQDSKFFSGNLFKGFLISDVCCRFRPTCSEYCYQAIEKYGIIKGILLGLRRIFKCHPWSKGGKDLLD